METRAGAAAPASPTPWSPPAPRPLYERVCEQLRARGLTVGTGIFAADMKVALINDGPVTLLLETPSAATPG